MAENIGDYLFNGNAVSLITSRDASQFPSALVWVPAARVMLERTGQPWPYDLRYLVGGIEVPAPMWCM